MYANLKVTTSTGKILRAWKVQHQPPHTTVYLDGQNGTGSYPEPKGAVMISGAVTIEADF